MLFLFSSVLVDFGVHSSDTILPKQVGAVAVIEQVGSFAQQHAFRCHGVGGVVKVQLPTFGHGFLD